MKGQRISIGDARTFLARHFEPGDTVTTKSFADHGLLCDTNVLGSLVGTGELTRRPEKIIGQPRGNKKRTTPMNAYEVVCIRERDEVNFDFSALLLAIPVERPPFTPRIKPRIHKLQG